MASTSESAANPNLNDDMNGNAEKNQEESEKNNREYKPKFTKKNGESKSNATEHRDFEGMTLDIGGFPHVEF